MRGFPAGIWLILTLSLQLVDLEATKKNPLNEPDVPFPPAQPTAENLVNICLHSQSRPRYPPSFFPRSGASHFRRRGKAINRLESWLTSCCNGLQESSHLLCCATQAWKQALHQFCAEEYGTMTTAYDCCGMKGDARWACFNEDVSNPDYEPTPGYTAPAVPLDLLFIFTTQSC
ncbi:extracellular matrix protein 1 isoform X1 [Synchiropus splendidus]|uniref:extracellular matrix protein 1 isoform X1 n=1 Tax=Synchiropus splendidus TaxID=270530 RepID=UPI00237DDAE1|nr:extracellular matrix protein 1 isoform X1 [Synchiropus splendidus]